MGSALGGDSVMLWQHMNIFHLNSIAYENKFTTNQFTAILSGDGPFVWHSFRLGARECESNA